MKRKVFFGVIAVLAISAVAAWNVSLISQNSELSGTMLDNIEALSNGEGRGRGCTVDLNCICETSHNDYHGYRNN
jgi:hypothetical protein